MAGRGCGLMKNQPIWRRFGYALDGLKASLASEKSVRGHVMAIAAAVLLLLFLQPPPVWWALFALAAGLMLAVELINTAVEKLIDHIHPDQHSVIKVVKDTLAAAVLVSCIAAGAVVLVFVWVYLR